jgi:hypothetical protein
VRDSGSSEEKVGVVGEGEKGKGRDLVLREGNNGGAGAGCSFLGSDASESEGDTGWDGNGEFSVVDDWEGYGAVEKVDRRRRRSEGRAENSIDFDFDEGDKGYIGGIHMFTYLSRAGEGAGDWVEIGQRPV